LGIGCLALLLTLGTRVELPWVRLKILGALGHYSELWQWNNEFASGMQIITFLSSDLIEKVVREHKKIVGLVLSSLIL